MPSFFSDPMVQSSLLPLTLALVLTGLLRLLLGPVRGRRIANLSVILSFFILACLIQGLIFPPVGSTHKIPYLLGGLALVALLVDLLPVRGKALMVLLVVVPALALGWLNATRWAGADSELLVKEALLYGATLLVLWSLFRQRGRGLDGVVELLFASVGFAAISLMGASALLTTQGFALAACLGGYALWNWPRHRFALGGGVLMAAVGLVLLINQALLLTDTSVLALALLLPVFFADSLFSPLEKRWPLNDVTRPLVIALVCLLWVLIAAGVSFSINPITADAGY
ncbi:hypothetical protein [Motiliproteus sp. SC1-56]|uniref:hypothetical protein n=1 Tax=Motiliproteus sp. SC1-56 TaxID=2799565 RepID=UPI001A8D7C81|nr:hypothetical protein [Motiliproteus sp. SC1-56]